MQINKDFSCFNKLKIRNVYPFYISSPNSIFFESDIRKYKNSSYYKRLVSDIKKNQKNNDRNFNEILSLETINYHENFQKILNEAIKKVNSIVGSEDTPLFAFESRNEHGSPIFVTQNVENRDLKIIGDKFAQKRYIFKIYVNPKSYLSKYVDQFQITFYFDEKNQMISGALSLNHGLSHKEDENLESIFQKIFINNLCRYFLENEWKKISILTLLDLFDDLKISTSGPNVSFSSKLKEHWNNYVDAKFLNFVDVDKKQYYDDLFNSMFISNMVMLILYEELKNYVRSDRPDLVLKNIKDSSDYSNVKQGNNSNRDLVNLYSYIKNKHINLPNMKINDIETVYDVLELLSDYSKYSDLEPESLWRPIPSYEVVRNDETPFFIDKNDDDILHSSNTLKLLFTVTMFPQLFGMETNNTNFSSYAEVKNLFEKIDFTDPDIKESHIKNANLTVCEKNYDYVTFVNPSLAFLIIKNNNPTYDLETQSKTDLEFAKDPNFNLADNYLWAIVYNQSRVWKLVTINNLVDKAKDTEPWKLRDHLYEVNNLQFDNYDDFYGLMEIEEIVNKMNNYVNLKESVKLLLKKLNNDDQRYGKTKERGYLTVGVVTASIFGILDFFTCVFSILTVTPELEAGSSKDIRSIVVISIGSTLALILFVTLMYAIFLGLRSYIRSKKNSKNGF